MTGPEAGVALLWSVVPSDRALLGWCPPVWLSPVPGPVLAAPWASMRLPCGWADELRERAS